MARRTRGVGATHLLVALLAAVVAGCADSPTAPGQQLVVEAFLYAGEPVTSVRITGTIALSSTDTTAPPINDAEIRLIKRGVNFTLVPTGDSGYYRYPGTDLTVAVGDTFTLEVTRSGATVTAETIVPPPPVGVAVSKATIPAPSFGFGPPGGSLEDTSAQLAVTWSNPDRALHFVVVRSIEQDPVSFLPGDFGDLPGFRSISRPDSNDYSVVNSRTLRYYGLHEVTVYRVNREYAQLYENRLQDSRDLNEPPTNIRNGLGVFSAFSSAKAFFTVVSQ